MPRKLTIKQQELLEIVVPLLTERALTYDQLKNLASFKSFDGSFNALIHKGHIIRKEDKFYII